MKRPTSNVQRPTLNEPGALRASSLDAGRWTLGVGRSLAFAALLMAPAAARACAVCGGATDEHIVQAGNTVLWTLLGLVGFIFAATGGTIWYLWHKANTPIPPHIALIESLSSDDLTADN